MLTLKSERRGYGIRGTAVGMALGSIRLYQITLSETAPHYCRFVPSCSQYTFEAIEKHGLWRGIWLGIKRLTRCHPFGSGGYDPVP